jgi:hypothetical protein
MFLQIKLAQFSIKPTTSGFELTLKALREINKCILKHLPFMNVAFRKDQHLLYRIGRDLTPYIFHSLVYVRFVPLFKSRYTDSLFLFMPCDTRSKHGIYILFHI